MLTNSRNLKFWVGKAGNGWTLSERHATLHHHLRRVDTTFRDSSDVSLCEKAYESGCWDYEPHHCTRCKSDLSVQLFHYQRKSFVMVNFKVCLLCLSFPFPGLREPHDRRASFRLLNWRETGLGIRGSIHVMVMVMAMAMAMIMIE